MNNSSDKQKREFLNDCDYVVKVPLAVFLDCFPRELFEAFPRQVRYSKIAIPSFKYSIQGQLSPYLKSIERSYSSISESPYFILLNSLYLTALPLYSYIGIKKTSSEGDTVLKYIYNNNHDPADDIIVKSPTYSEDFTKRFRWSSIKESNEWMSSFAGLLKNKSVCDQHGLNDFSENFPNLIKFFQGFHSFISDLEHSLIKIWIDYPVFNSNALTENINCGIMFLLYALFNKLSQKKIDSAKKSSLESIERTKILDKNIKDVIFRELLFLSLSESCIFLGSNYTASFFGNTGKGMVYKSNSEVRLGQPEKIYIDAKIDHKFICSSIISTYQFYEDLAFNIDLHHNLLNHSEILLSKWTGNNSGLFGSILENTLGEGFESSVSVDLPSTKPYALKNMRLQDDHLIIIGSDIQLSKTAKRINDSGMGYVYFNSVKSGWDAEGIRFLDPSEYKINNDVHQVEERIPLVDSSDSSLPAPYKITIAQDRGKKGTLTIPNRRGIHRFPLTKIQFQIMYALAKKCIDEGDLPEEKRGWLKYSEIIKSVEEWKRRDDDEDTRRLIYNQVKSIRKFVESKRLENELIQTQENIGYRLATHPELINLE